MTTYRSVEPPTGIDAILEKLFPFLAGSPPQPGEHGIDSAGRVYTMTAAGTWAPALPWYAGIPGMGAKAERAWAESGGRWLDSSAPQHEAEAG